MRGGIGLMTKYPVFTEILGQPHIILIHFRGDIKRKLSKSIWKDNHQLPSARCFVADKFVSPFTRTRGAAERWHDDKVWIPPKNDDVIYKQPLIFNMTIIMVDYLSMCRMRTMSSCSAPNASNFSIATRPSVGQSGQLSTCKISNVNVFWIAKVQDTLPRKELKPSERTHVPSPLIGRI